MHDIENKKAIGFIRNTEKQLVVILTLTRCLIYGRLKVRFSPVANLSFRIAIIKNHNSRFYSGRKSKKIFKLVLRVKKRKNN